MRNYDLSPVVFWPICCKLPFSTRVNMLAPNRKRQVKSRDISSRILRDISNHTNQTLMMVSFPSYLPMFCSNITSDGFPVGKTQRNSRPSATYGWNEIEATNCFIPMELSHSNSQQMHAWRTSFRNSGMANRIGKMVELGDGYFYSAFRQAKTATVCGQRWGKRCEGIYKYNIYIYNRNQKILTDLERLQVWCWKIWTIILTWWDQCKLCAFFGRCFRHAFTCLCFHPIEQLRFCSFSNTIFCMCVIYISTCT